MYSVTRYVLLALVLATGLAASPALADHNYRGFAGAHTPRCVNLTKPMNIGSTNGGPGALGQVSLLQDFLSRYGYSVPMTGYFGQVTARAVRAFQADHGLPVTGTVGPAMHSYVRELTCEDSSPLAGGPDVLCATSHVFCPAGSYARQMPPTNLGFNVSNFYGY